MLRIKIEIQPDRTFKARCGSVTLFAATDINDAGRQVRARHGGMGGKIPKSKGQPPGRFAVIAWPQRGENARHQNRT